MKQLPEAARVIVERARDAHDPSEAQLQNMLANLHAKLGYAPAPSEPAGVPEAAGTAVSARGLLHAKLLKIVLSIAAIGGMTALVAPRLWTPEPAQAVVAPVQPPAAASAEPEQPAEPAAPSEPAMPVEDTPQASDEVKSTSRAKPSAARRSAAPPRAAASRVDAVRAVPERAQSVPASPLQAAVSRVDAARAVPERAQPAPASPPQAAVTYADVVQPPSAAAPQEKVLLSDDVVPLQTARKRAQDKARAASDADELRLIDRAASLLRDGDPEEALELLQEHGRKFPTSQLALERRGLSVLARCGAGQLEQGRRERDEFLRAAGSAPIAARVRKACPEPKP